MPPKKREKDSTDVSSKFIGRDQQLQSDHELFLQAFEKPTQIYRYLRTRNMISPIFLHRTLTYMKHRMSRTHKKRTEFKVDSMLTEKLNKTRLDKVNGLGEYMTLLFIGFFDKSICDDILLDEVVRVETVLLKISHKKRKDSSSEFKQVTIGTSDVNINPTETNKDGKVAAISIPTESFKPIGTPLNRSYILLLRVETLPKIKTINEDNEEEPSSKRQKPNTKLYGSELVIFDKHSRCLLAEGEYELALQEVVANTKNCSPKKHSTWEIIPDESCLELFDRQENPFEIFSKCPTLKFCLKWTNEPLSGLVDRPKVIDQQNGETITNGEIKDELINCPNHNNNNNSILPVRNGIKESSSTMKTEEPIQIVYQFIYNNNSRQQTEACADLHCPWCSLDCLALYSLLKHLKLCHARFTFTYVPISNGARIDVAINDMYDGSYTGSPHDLVGPAGCAFARAGPVRRTIVTHLLVCRPRRQKPTLTEFLELDENELNNQRPYITGHNRLYHHTETCLPVHPKELDIDSEGEGDPLWLQYKTMQMIDEFTDVNEGEKELMKMWNIHVMKHGFVGDCQLPIACDMFLDMRGREILQKNLYRNFVLHMCSLFDYGLVSPDVVCKTIQKLQSILSTYQDGRKVLTDSRDAQLDFWTKFGKAKQEQQEKEKYKHPNLLNTSAKTLQSKIQKSAIEGKKLAASPHSEAGKNSDKAKESGEKNASTSKRRTIITQMAAPTECSKRKISMLRDSPPRRRSAPSSDQPKTTPTRRKSLATYGGGQVASSSTSSSAAHHHISMRKRIPVTVAKVDKH